MEFSDGASFFDSDPVYDGVAGTYLFDGQVASFNDATSDGASNRRRTLSLAPDLVIPSHRIVMIHDERWLVGIATPDGFQGDVVRQNFNMKRVTNLFAVLTPQQAVQAATGTPVYVHRMYFKDTVNALTDSEYDTFWNVFMATEVVIVPGTFFRDEAGTLYRARKGYVPLEDLCVAQTDEIDAGARVTATLVGGTFDPVADSYSSSTSNVPAIKLDAGQFYRHRAVSDSLIQAGDFMFFFTANVTLAQGHTFAVGGVTWRVVSIQTEIDSKVAQARRV